MKTLASVLFCLFILQTGFAQDAVMQKDSTRLSGKIKEITDDYVVLQENTAEAKSTTIQGYQIAYIVLQNGYSKRYNIEKPIPVKKVGKNKRHLRTDSIYYIYSQNVSFNYLSFFNREINLIYGRDYRKRHLYVQVPLSLG